MKNPVQSLSRELYGSLSQRKAIMLKALIAVGIIFLILASLRLGISVAQSLEPGQHRPRPPDNGVTWAP